MKNNVYCLATFIGLFGFLCLHQGTAYADLTPEQVRQQVQNLIDNPDKINRALENRGTDRRVREYFEKIYENPRTLKEKIGDQTVPLEFRRFLLGKIWGWAEKRRYPNAEERTSEYAFALLKAFRDPNKRFRNWAFHVFAKDMLPGLERAERDRVMNSLRQHQTDPQGKLVAIPALLLVEDVDAATRRLQGLIDRGESDPELLSRALEAVARDDIQQKRYKPEIQEVVTVFLKNSDQRVLDAAAEVLADTRESVRSRADQAYPAALDKVARIAVDHRHRVETIVTALDILGRNKEWTFFENRKLKEADKPIHDAIIAGLSHRDPRVRKAAADAFDRIKPADEPSQLALVIAMEDSNENVRRAAYVALSGQDKHRAKRRIYSPVVLDRLIDVLSHRDYATRVHAARLLDRNPPRDHGNYLKLVDLYSTVAPDVRDMVFDAIEGAKSLQVGEEGREPVVEATMKRLAESTDARTTTWVTKSAEQLRLKLHDLIPLLNNENPRVRELAAERIENLSDAELRKINNRSDSEVHDAIAKALREGNETVRRSLLRTLGKIIPQSPVVLAAIAENLTSSDAEARSLAHRILQDMVEIKARNKYLRTAAERPEFREALARVVKDSSQEAGLAPRIIVLLKSKSSELANALLEKAHSSRTPVEVRRASAEALQTTGTHDLPFLLNVAKSYSNQLMAQNKGWRSYDAETASHLRRVLLRSADTIAKVKEGDGEYASLRSVLKQIQKHDPAFTPVYELAIDPEPAQDSIAAFVRDCNRVAKQ